jgi:hypothetical protein
MAIQTICLEFCSEPVDLYCPVCGQTLFTAGLQQDTCPHVIFISDSATDNWAWLQEQYIPASNRHFQQKYADACKNGYFGTFEEYLGTIRADQAAAAAATIVSRKSAFCLSVSTSDIGCGGMYNGTIQVIFDYLSPQSELISIQKTG